MSDWKKNSALKLETMNLMAFRILANHLQVSLGMAENYLITYNIDADVQIGRIYDLTLHTVRKSALFFRL